MKGSKNKLSKVMAGGLLALSLIQPSNAGNYTAEDYNKVYRELIKDHAKLYCKMEDLNKHDRYRTNRAAKLTDLRFRALLNELYKKMANGENPYEIKLEGNIKVNPWKIGNKECVAAYEILKEMKKMGCSNNISYNYLKQTYQRPCQKYLPIE